MASKYRNITYVCLLAATLLGFVLRWYIGTRSGIWRDEGLFLFVVRSHSIREMLSFLHWHESHPPLFYFMMRFWLDVFGDSERSAIALPIILGALTVPAVFYTGTAFFSRRTGGIAAILVTAAPALAQRSALIRPYSLLPLLYVLSIAALWQMLHGRTRRACIVYGMCLLALLFTHNFSLLVLASQCIGFLVACAFLPSTERWPAIRRFALVQCSILVLYAPWIPTLLYQLHHAGHGPDRRAFSIAPLFTMAGTATFSAGSEGHYIGSGFSVENAIGLLVILATAGIAAVRARKETSSTPQYTAIVFLGIVPLAAVAMGLILSRTAILLLPRTLTTFAPGLIILIARGIDCLDFRRISIAPLAVTATVWTVFLAIVLTPFPEIKSNARELAGLVGKGTRSSDLIVITPEWLASSFNYYFTGENDQIDYPTLHRVGAMSFADLPRRLADRAALVQTEMRLKQARRENRRVWLIMQQEQWEMNFPVDMPVLTQKVMDAGTGTITLIRSNQIRRLLTDLYGDPGASRTFRDTRYGDENLVALLFEP